MDIEFGEIRESLPQIGLPPDQDGRFAVRQIGHPKPDDLRIFVDLDIMRDMEAHARSNRQVELGGVLLGKQQLDSSGRPFVYVFEALRAEHYEATKGSFKFTHETWSQISRDRAKFHPELEMVGWYHTHPGWTVFLSEMDLFICKHFFNRPLDLALVIDPCNDDRGWFQWVDTSDPTSPDRVAVAPQHNLTTDPVPDSDSRGRPMSKPASSDNRDPERPRLSRVNRPSSKRTRRTAGFLLVSNRQRKQELDYFAALYNQQPAMTPDPRYTPIQPNPVTPMIQIPDSRNPLLEIALLSTMLLQMAMIGLISWKIFSHPGPTGNNGLSSDAAAISQKMDQPIDSVDPLKASPRMQAYQEVLSRLVTAQTGDPQLVEQFTQLKVDHQQLEAHLKAQTWMARDLEQQNQELNSRLETQTSQNQRLSQQLQEARAELSQKHQQLDALKQTVQKQSLAQTQSSAQPQPSPGPRTSDGNPALEPERLTPPAAMDLPWWLAAGAGLGVLGMGCGFGFLLGRRHLWSAAEDLEPANEPARKPELSRPGKTVQPQEKS
jgi:proteasome lid subunit RPN8/RPN11